MKKKVKGRTKLLTMILAVSLFGQYIPINPVLAIEREKVNANFLSVQQDGAEIITIDVEAATDSIEIISITLPDGSIVEDSLSEYTALMNDTYKFVVSYRETITQEISEVIETPTVDEESTEMEQLDETNIESQTLEGVENEVISEIKDKEEDLIITGNETFTYTVSSLSSENKTITEINNKPTVLALGDVEINDTNFPDDNFRSYIMRYDVDNNQLLSQTELAVVVNINVQAKSISSLKGIEYFTNLKVLTCSYNDLTELDLTNNKKLVGLYCGVNKLGELDLRNQSLLEILYCENNELKEIKLPVDSALELIVCSLNKLTELDVSNCLLLTSLDVSHNDNVKINLKNNELLRVLMIGYSKLSELDVSNNKRLIFLEAQNNELTKLDLQNNSLLTELRCDRNKLTELDVSNNTKMKYLDCSNNQLTEINLTQNVLLDTLMCFNNNLIMLDLSYNSNLMNLHFANNNLIELDVSNNLKLEGLVSMHNQMPILDLSLNTMLEYPENAPQEIKGMIEWDGNNYLLDMNKIVGTENIEKVTVVKSADIEVAYDNVTGIATFPNKPFNISYLYNVPIHNGTKEMLVNVMIEKIFTVKFVDFDGSTIGVTQIVEAGHAAIAPNNPTREGYTFKMWDKPFDNVRVDLLVQAIYTENTLPPVKPVEPNEPPVKPIKPIKPVVPPIIPEEKPIIPIVPEIPPVVTPEVNTPSVVLPIPPNDLPPTKEPGIIITPDTIDKAGQNGEGNLDIKINPNGKIDEKQDETIQPEFGPEEIEKQCIFHWIILLLAAILAIYGVIRHKQNKEQEKRMLE